MKIKRLLIDQAQTGKKNFFLCPALPAAFLKWRRVSPFTENGREIL
jgi:hypothetical protein